MSQRPSTLRPIPLERRADLVAASIVFQGTAWWVIKDPISLQYHRLRNEEYEALQLLDGERSLEELRDDLRKRCPTSRHTLKELQRIVTEFHKQELVRSGRLGQGYVVGYDARRDWWKRVGKALINPLSIQLPGIDPQRMLDRLLPFVGWIFHPVVVAAVLLGVAAAVGWMTIHFEQFRRQLPEFNQFFAVGNIVWMWGILAVSKIIHEFGHGLACRRYRAECHEMGVMLLVFSPCLFCDVTDSWMLPNKWQRIMIGAAGMYIEAILSSIAIVLWWNTADGLVHHLCLDLFFVSSVSTVIFNANPLMRYDGYYMLSDFLEIPNLRPQADQMVRDTFLKVCLGIDPPHDPFAPDRGREWFILFAVSAWIYRWVVVFGIMYFLCTVLKPHGLQSVGMTAAFLSAVSMVVSLGVSIYRIASAPREEPVNRTRLGVSLAVLSALLIAALFIPLPLHVTGDFVIEPEQVEHVYVTVPGILSEQKTTPGARVKKGDVLGILTNAEKSDRRREIAVELAVQQQERKLQRALGDSSQMALVEERIASLTKQLHDVDEQLAQLTLVAPSEGTVIAPERQHEPKLDTAREQVAGWFGTPLDPPNRGCWLETRTHYLSLAPNDRWQAILLVDQADRDVLQPGEKITLKLEERPDLTLTGIIQEVSQREEQFAPQGLAQKHGGKLATTTDSSGRERLNTAAYQAVIRLEGDLPAMRAGFRGRAHIARPLSAGAWLWRLFRQTIHFRL